MLRTHVYKENKKAVMGIKRHVFSDFFSEKRANGFGKGQRNVQYT